VTWLWLYHVHPWHWQMLALLCMTLYQLSLWYGLFPVSFSEGYGTSFAFSHAFCVFSIEYGLVADWNI
jgi:Na+/glutamate symporter